MGCTFVYLRNKLFKRFEDEITQIKRNKAYTPRDEDDLISIGTPMTNGKKPRSQPGSAKNKREAMGGTNTNNFDFEAIQDLDK